MPAYRNGETIRRAIDSILGQDYENWVLLVIDDRSPDDSLAVAADLARHDSRIVVRANPVNFGLVANWQSGIRHCLSAYGASYVALLDPEDQWSSEWISTSLLELERCHQASLSVTGTEYWWPNKAKTQTRRYSSIERGSQGNVVTQLVLKGYGGVLHGIWRLEPADWLANTSSSTVRALLVMEDVFVAYIVSRFGLVAADKVLTIKAKGLRSPTSREGGDAGLYSAMGSPWKRIRVGLRVVLFLAIEWIRGRTDLQLVLGAPILIARVERATWRAYGWRGAV